jgi:putative ABC transport system substrate-binding protein
VNRRYFLTLAGAAASLRPLAALAQRSGLPVVGFLNSGSAKEFARFVEAFRVGLREAGYVDGRDVVIEYRWAEGRVERLPEMVADLVRARVAVIVATGGNAPALAAKAATSTTPIVFTGGGDPVRLRLVASLSRPGGNATGISNVGASLEAKRLEILRDLLPAAGKIALLVNPQNPNAGLAVGETQAVADRIGKRLHVVNADKGAELDAAFADIARSGAQALLVVSDPIFMNRRSQIVAFAARQRIPATYPFREFAVAGGLMSYGADLADIYRQAGIYAGRILRGAKPADLPVMQPVKFELVVNLKTAKALGLRVPESFLQRADALIE